MATVIVRDIPPSPGPSGPGQASQGTPSLRAFYISGVVVGSIVLTLDCTPSTLLFFRNGLLEMPSSQNGNQILLASAVKTDDWFLAIGTTEVGNV